MKNFNLNNLTTEELLYLQSAVSIELAKRNDNDKYKASCNIQFDLVYETIKSNPQLEDYHGLSIIAEEDKIEVVYNGNTLYYIVRNSYFLDSLDEILEVKELVEEVLKGTFFTNKLKDKVRKTGVETETDDLFVQFIHLNYEQCLCLETKDNNEEFYLLENKIETPITELIAQEILEKLEVI